MHAGLAPARLARSSTTIAAVFDGWGYVRLFPTDVPKQRGKTGSSRRSTPLQSPTKILPTRLASGTCRSTRAPSTPTAASHISPITPAGSGSSLQPERLEEVGAFVDEGGNNFWGVGIWRDEHGEKFVLASDRDFGLYIFQYTGATP